MVEPTNELMMQILRELQAGQADLKHEMRTSFARLESDFMAMRHHQIGVQVDQENFRVDLADLKARLVALEIRMARRED